MSENNKALVRRWFNEVWNQRQARSIDELLAADGVIYGLIENAPMKGAAEFKKFHEVYCGAFPDLQIVVDDMIAEGDRVAIRCTVKGQHLGDHLGLKATNAPVEFSGMAIVVIRDGRIVEGWNNFDFAQMNKQLGLNASSAAEAARQT